ncbi:hypothetical protein EFK50_19045 [Nocardioides marmoriginsengisoli]|uniref:Uncharacterized protein n=1 Tax=Nocardioides marmoriginsengisoli TaxID=661483 RepID=A0A3N0CBS3_9ACTN|nr:hypothetical protein [Nocardioides marmoriginsengisoli]RNL60433.1 hypothetical protein EFK50_19045 [Nocardioides marmoriginsengisoli]
MNDFRLKQADPYDADAVADLAGADLALLDEIIVTPDARLADWRPKQRSLRSRLVQAGAAAAVVTALVAVPTLVANDPDPAGPGTTAPSADPVDDDPTVVTPIRYAAAVVKVARANPRILVTEGGWKVRSVEGFDPTAGQMTFQLGPDKWVEEELASGSSRTNEAPQLSVSWYPASQYDGYLQSRAEKGNDVRQEHVLGQDAQVVSYAAGDHAVMLPPEGKVFLELRGRLGDRAAFLDFLQNDLAKVGVKEWLQAMPASVVTVRNEATAVATVLDGVPLPPGFVTKGLGTGVALDPYQFGAKVAGAVACGWLDEWTRARAAGDAEAQQRAVDAMGTSRDWKVLRDMDVEGDYPEVVWGYADRIASGAAPAGYRSGLGCPGN